MREPRSSIVQLGEEAVCSFSLTTHGNLFQMGKIPALVPVFAGHPFDGDCSGLSAESSFPTATLRQLWSLIEEVGCAVSRGNPGRGAVCAPGPARLDSPDAPGGGSGSGRICLGSGSIKRLMCVCLNFRLFKSRGWQ